MAMYLIGDIQGCDQALGRLLDQLDFSPSRDHLGVLGDLVNRGPSSTAVLRRLQAFGSAVTCVLGNHDLSLLALSQGARRAHRLDTLDGVLDAPDRQALIDWLRHQPLAALHENVLMVHAGLLPSWDLETTLSLAREVETVLKGPSWGDFMFEMFGNSPAAWDPSLTGTARLRVIVNALTRLRFCSPDGVMDLKASGPPEDAPAGTLAWFDVPGRRSANTRIAFGHWSTLGLLRRPNLLALDTGCVWGGALTALRLASGNLQEQIFQQRCEQAQVPGE